jgi:hypothetical protein
MENNYWDEQYMEDPLLKFHEEQMKKMDIPKWIKDIKCPFCKEKIPLRAIRNIQLCLNTRNFGEIAIEVFCDDCKKMDTLYFRTKIKNLSCFIDCIQDSCEMPYEPVVEEDMYKLNYNNILELMVKLKSEENNDAV